MGELPLLTDDGAVRFASRDALLGGWDDGPGRGILVVKTARALAPLEQLTIRLEADGLGALTLEAEVIRPDPTRTVLRLVAGPLPRPAFNPFATPAAVVTLADNPFAPTAASRTPAFNPFAPTTKADVVESPPERPRVGALLDLDGDDGDTMPPPLMPPPNGVGTPTVTTAIALEPPDPPPSPPVTTTAIALEPPDPAPVTTTAIALEPPDPPPSPPMTTTAIALEPPDPPPPPPVTMKAIALEPPDAPPPPPTTTAIALEPPDPPPPPPVTMKAIALEPPDPPPPTTTAIALEPPPTPAPPTPSAPVPGLAVMTPTVSATRPPAAPLPAANATQNIDATPLRTALPPYFSGDCLRFAGPEDLRHARGDLLTVGALLAVSEASAPATAIEVRLAVGSVETRGRVKVTVAQAQKGTVVVQAVRRDDWRALLDELDAALRGEVSAAAPTPTTPTTAPKTTGGVTLQFGKTGTLVNPVTVQGILAMPLHRSVSEQDLKTPTVPLLLRWLRTTRGIFRLDLTTDGQPAHTCILVDGREVRSTVSLATLGKSMAGHRSTWTLTELPRAPTMSHTGRSLHLIVEVVRGLLAQHDPDEVAAAFPHTKDPRTVRAVGSVADALGFSGAHARLVKSSLQGDETVASVTRSAAGARTAWDVLVALELFGGLAFGQTTPDDASATDDVAGAASTEPTRPALLDKDHFGALGLHWSCSPHDVTEAWQRARREYGHGGPKRPADAAAADLVMKRLEEAWRVLGPAESRRAYRRATFNMVWPHQATLLVQQAKLALYRKDLVEAKNLLEAAQDMSPSPEAEHLLAQLNK